MLDAPLTNLSPAARARYAELLEDAASALQREMLRRAMLAGHTLPELHAFADAVRPLTDSEIYEACTVHDSDWARANVEALLRAQSDPFEAFALKGGLLTPAAEKSPPLSVVQASAPSSAARKRPAFQADSTGARLTAQRPRSVELERRPSSGLLLEPVIRAATRDFGLRWAELEIGPTFTCQQALLAIRPALDDGLIVPIALKPLKGELVAFALVLQVTVGKGSRALQLLDVSSSVCAWVNEGDLLNSQELPFPDKRFRRVSHVGLPRRSD